ncbi:hypothetical protein JCM16303_005258 [Sporobolomyces ruberrimus]
MPKPTEPDKIPITSAAQLRTEFDSLHTALALEETEHTWEKIDKAVKRFQAVVRGGAGKKELAEEYVRGMRDKTLANGLIRSLATERTRLSGSTLDLIGSSTRLGPQFAPLLPLYLPTLLRLLCRTNKLYINRSTLTITSIVKNTKLVDVLRYIVGEWQGESGKSASFREKAAELTAYILSSGPGGELQMDKEVLDRRVEELEWIIKTAAVDRDAKLSLALVRLSADSLSIASFTSPMTPTIRRYLNVNAGGPSHSTTATSATGSRAPPIKKPRVPSALSSSVSQSSASAATASVPAPPRPAAALSRSVGPASRPLGASTTRRAPPPSAAPSDSSSTGQALSRSTSTHSVGMAPPPPRTARAESARTASNPPSRPASRSDDQRRELGASTSSISSVRSVTEGSSSSTHGGSFRPTPGARTGASSAPPFKPAVRTASKGATASSGPAVEPRRARRVAQEPPVVSAPPPAPPSSVPTLSRSTSSTALRAQPLSSSTSSRPAPTLPSTISTSTAAPFRPHKPTTSSLASKSTISVRPPPPAASSTRSTNTTSKPLVSSTTSSSARPTAKSGPSVPPTATLATKSRREKERQDQEDKEKETAKVREKERKSAAIEVAALEAAAEKQRVQEVAEKEAEERKLREIAEKAKEVPLPIEAEDETDEGGPEEQISLDGEDENEEVEQHEEAFVAESQESVGEEVGMESEYLLESQGKEDEEAESISDIEDQPRAQGGNEAEEEEPTLEAQQIVEDRARDGTAAEESEAAIATGAGEGMHPGQGENLVEPESPVVEEPESPVVEEIRLVGDLPPSPLPSSAEESITEPRTAEYRRTHAEETDQADVSAESATTIAPSPGTALMASPSPQPDLSIALDTLALTNDSTETSLLADTTLPRSPLDTAPLPSARFDSSTPALFDSNEEFFPQSIEEPTFAALPPLSPEPCQTASIVLETPPRFDDPPAQLRLPGRPIVALNFPGHPSTRPSIPQQHEERAAPEEETAPEPVSEEEEPQETDEESDEASEVASPSHRATTLGRRGMPPPTPLRSVGRQRQRQPVFFPEAGSYTDDVEASFEEPEETDEEESYQVPLNDAQNEADYDDSDLGEAEVEQEEDQGTPKAHSKIETDVTTEDARGDSDQGRKEVGEDEDESRLELEQPELRFYDETESEPEVTMEEDEMVSEEIEEEDEADEEVVSAEEAVVEQNTNILKRSLRSRVVTVDLEATSTKTPGRNRSREILSEMQ